MMRALIVPVLIAVSVVLAGSPAFGQQQERPVAAGELTSPSRALPANSVVKLVALEEVSSSRAKVGDVIRFSVAEDVVDRGEIVIPRGSPATGEISWKTGRAVGGKSGKFDVSFREIRANGRTIRLMGKHRQEGRGNTVGALLGSIVISGRSGVMLPGQEVVALTAEPVPY